MQQKPLIKESHSHESVDTSEYVAWQSLLQQLALSSGAPVYYTIALSQRLDK